MYEATKSRLVSVLPGKSKSIEKRSTRRYRMKKMHKFRNKPTVVDGIKFSSKKEAKRYSILKVCQEMGEIKDLECHPTFPLFVWQFDGGHNEVKKPLFSPDNRQIKFIGDFRYNERTVDGEWEVVVEDCKGYMPKGDPVYRLFSLKAALIHATLGIKIRIT